MAVPEVSAAVHANSALQNLLARAQRLKPTTEIEPPLPAPEFVGDQGLPTPSSIPRGHYFGAIEDAARAIYQSRCASTPITSPDFVEIWNLIDILSVTGDSDQNDPALAWWLIEELLETQSIDGCRIVFDYLESRRERLVGALFDKKQLIILRAFNELLRRLSRAEEAVFCGRVFVFLFQSFPLGARSSVNLKGDFHKENLTTFEEPGPEVPSSDTVVGEDAMTGIETIEAKPDDANVEAETKTPDLSTIEALYPAFWTMQQAFSNPPEFFFKQDRITEFRSTIEATLKKFREVPKVNQAAADLRGVKRNADSFNDDDGQDQFASTFNPKYLTSKELFGLELSDLAFQRHILVQALILLDFLLSLTEARKKKLGNIVNKSLNIEWTLGDEDAKWAQWMRKAISTYLTDGQLSGEQEGKYYHRMVETVLSRDKNWVRWKLDFCNQIRQPPVHSSEFNAAQNGAKRMCMPARIRPSPMGALDLGFLRDAADGGMQDELVRSELPDASALVRDVQNVDLDLEMASTEEEKKDLEDQKMSKTWRALRLMSKTKLNLFDKVDDGRNLECFLQAPVEEGTQDDIAHQPGDSAEGEDDEGEKPETLKTEVTAEQKDVNVEEAATQEDEAMGDADIKAEATAVVSETVAAVVPE